MVDLDELERLEREATPGPWKIDREELGVDFDDEEQACAFPERIGPFDVAGHDSDDVYKTEVDADFLAATRNALPDLIAELRTLRARVAEMEANAVPCPACGDLGHKMSCHVRSREAIERYLDGLKRDAAAWAKVREAVGDDEGLLCSLAAYVRDLNEHTVMERAPVRDRVIDAVADAIRAEEGDHDE